MQHSPGFLCVHHELHEYDQDEDSSKACVPPVLLSHDVFTFRKVLVAVERMGGLSQRMDIWLFLAGCLPGGLVNTLCLSINYSVVYHTKFLLSTFP
jgi:hypothetical protein